ncbi:MAG: protein phosphatase 2C family protein [Oligoflexia bacterium]|nr:protein phosphatase 2C family protein [Oligoflexia bacterium]
MNRKTFAFGVCSEQGNWPVQEDGFFVDPSRGIFTLLDGFGGKGAGDISVKKSVEEIRKHIEEIEVSSSGPYNKYGQWQRFVFSECNSILLERNKNLSSNKRGGCSLLIGNIDENNILTATNLGNCSLFVFRKDEFYPILLAQVANPMSLGESYLPDQSIGLMIDIMPETRSIKLLSGDLVIAVSSSVGKNFSLIREAIKEEIQHRSEEKWSEIAKKIVSLDLLAGERNLTLLFLEARDQVIEINDDFNNYEENPLDSPDFDPLAE